MRYHVVYQFTDVNGHLDKMCITGDTEQDAKDKAKKIILQNKGRSIKLLKGYELKN